MEKNVPEEIVKGTASQISEEVANHLKQYELSSTSK